MKKTFKILLLIAGAWIVVPLLYLYVAFPIMDTVADQLKELSTLINIAFIGFFSTLIVLGVFRLFLPYYGHLLPNKIDHD
jgi:hypothetical protein